MGSGCACAPAPSPLACEAREAAPATAEPTCKTLVCQPLPISKGRCPAGGDPAAIYLTWFCNPVEEHEPDKKQMHSSHGHSMGLAGPCAGPCAGEPRAQGAPRRPR